MRVCGVVHRAVIVDIDLSFSVAAVQLFPAHHRIWKLKRSILDAFRIQTTIGAEVYILKEKTEQRLRNRGARLVDLHRDVLRLNNRNQQEERKKNPRHPCHPRLFPVMRRMNSTSSTM